MKMTPRCAFVSYRILNIKAVQVLEREKIRNLTKSHRKLSPHEHAPGWNEKLASASEAAVKVRPRMSLRVSFSFVVNFLIRKADRSTGKAEELVKTTLDHFRVGEEAERDNTESTTASYAREEVDGPLKGVGKEEVTIERDETVVDRDGTNRVVKETHKKVLKMTPSEENVSRA